MLVIIQAALAHSNRVANWKLTSDCILVKSLSGKSSIIFDIQCTKFQFFYHNINTNKDIGMLTIVKSSNFVKKDLAREKLGYNGIKGKIINNSSKVDWECTVLQEFHAVRLWKLNKKNYNISWILQWNCLNPYQSFCGNNVRCQMCQIF